MASTFFLTIILAVYSIQGATVWDSGNGKIHRLKVVQDVWLEQPHWNYNGHSFFILARHSGYPLKRSLIQFEDLPSTCPLNKIRWAKMYLYFIHAYKVSFFTVSQAPWFTHTVSIHRVKRSWKETEATSSRRYIGANWAQQYLQLGTDADSNPLYPVTTIHTSRPHGFVEFDITAAIRHWKEGYINYGLLLKVTDENLAGRDLRFYSKEHNHANRRPYVNVMCDY